MVEIAYPADHQRPQQIVEFQFYRDTIIPYSTSVEYEPDAFDFSPRPYRTRENLHAILSEFAAVDLVHRVKLTALKPIRLNRHTRWLDMSFMVHLDALVTFYQSRPELLWKFRRSVPRTNITEINPILLAAKPIICGTISLFLQNWKDQQKEQIRNIARRKAETMRGNADAILAFLGEPF